MTVVGSGLTVTHEAAKVPAAPRGDPDRGGAPDWLVRFGGNTWKPHCHHRPHIVVLNPEEVQDDLVRDMTEVLILMCARLCGRRLTRKHADAAIRATEGAA